jgi:UDP-N-acetylglucosamine 2-epimerase (non-hydrolysing)
MPEEVNRLLTDQISDHLFTPSPDADANLKREGIDTTRIHRVGNIMVDCLLANIDKARVRPAPDGLELQGNEYAVLTLHRPVNVDVPETLEKLMRMILEVAQMLPVVFPVHPRTRKRLEESGSMGKLAVKSNLLLMIDPLRYLDFIALLMRSKFVMTDSGGIQPETTLLGIPCLTLRDTTEWKVTLKQGTNILVGDKASDLISQANKIIKSPSVKKPRLPELWDGKTAARIVNILKKAGK